MKIVGPAIAVAATAMILASCFEKNNPAGPVNPGGTLTSSYPYTVSGSNIVVTVKRNICIGDTLKYITDLTMTYQLTGETLFISDPVVPGVSDSGSGIDVLVRQGGGSGLVGNWQWAGSKDSAGAPVDTSMSVLSDFMVTQFTATTMNTYSLKSNADVLYDTYVAMFAIFPEYFITVAKPNATTVRLTGGLSGEIVTITCPADNKTYTFSSTEPLHQLHVYYADPTSCPNDASPGWMMDFLVSNYQIALTKQADVDRGIKSLMELPGRFMEKLLF